MLSFLVQIVRLPTNHIVRICTKLHNIATVRSGCDSVLNLNVFCLFCRFCYFEQKQNQFDLNSEVHQATLLSFSWKSTVSKDKDARIIQPPGKTLAGLSVCVCMLAEKPIWEAAHASAEDTVCRAQGWALNEKEEYLRDPGWPRGVSNIWCLYFQPHNAARRGNE